MTTEHTPTRDGRVLSYRRIWIGRVLIGLGVAILLWAAWVGWRTYQAYSHLEAAADKVSVLRGQIKDLESVDLTAVTATVADLQVETASAVSATSDPLVRLASWIPWVGPNLDAVNEVSGTVDDLATRAAPQLLEVAATLDPSAFAVAGGSIDISPLVSAAPTLQSVDQAVGSAKERIAAVPRTSLVGPIQRALNTLQGQLTELQGTTAAAARVGRLAPPMLGAQTPRRYLVVFQNLAEPRATGGIFGSYVLLTIDKGRFALAGQGSASRDLGSFDPPLTRPAELPQALYGDLPGRFPTDVNLTPDFPTAAGLMAEMYRKRTGITVDGVLSVDPVALSYLLKGHPAIDVGGGVKVDSDNLTKTLLSTAYAKYPSPADSAARDAFLDRATAASFRAVTTGGSGDALLRAVLRGAREHRILLWSSHGSEQTDLTSVPVAGVFPSATAGFGVFRNDATGGKLGYYARGEIDLSAGACAGTDRTFALTARMSSTAPTTGLSEYVLGYQKGGSYVLRTNVVFFGAPGARFTTLTIDGKTVPFATATERGRSVITATVDLRSGQRVDVVAHGQIPGGSVVGPTRITPGVTDWPVRDAPLPSCSSG